MRDTEPAPGFEGRGPHPGCPPVCVDTHPSPEAGGMPRAGLGELGVGSLRQECRQARVASTPALGRSQCQSQALPGAVPPDTSSDDVILDKQERAAVKPTRCV